jgi:hypothetical protein
MLGATSVAGRLFDVPFDFDDVYARSLRVPLDTTKATVISLADLVQLKRSAGRPIDHADVEALLAISENPAP